MSFLLSRAAGPAEVEHERAEPVAAGGRACPDQGDAERLAVRVAVVERHGQRAALPGRAVRQWRRCLAAALRRGGRPAGAPVDRL